MSIDFSSDMHKENTEAGVWLVDADNPEEGLPVLKVWLYNTLHLIPDLDPFDDWGNGGLNNSTGTTPMSAGATYVLYLDDNMITDLYDRTLNLEELDNSFPITMRPDNGFYVGSTMDELDETLGDSAVLRYAGGDQTTQWSRSLQSYDLGTVPGNVRFEFSAKNMGWEGPVVLLWDQANHESSTWSDAWANTIVKVRMGGWSDVEYKTDSSSSWTNYYWDWETGEYIEETVTDTYSTSAWDNGSTPDLFNGQWQRYSIEIYGNNLVVSYCSEDCDNGDNWYEAYEITQSNVSLRTGSEYHLILRAREPLQFDNMEITTLNEDGTNATVQGNVFSEDFTDSMPDAFSTDVTSDLGLQDW
jgi:hypothetical protein